MSTIANTMGSFRVLIVTSALLGILFVPIDLHSVEATITVTNEDIELDADHNFVEGV